MPEALGHDQLSAASARTEHGELIHKRAHEEDTATGGFQEVLFRQRIWNVGEIEAAALVEDAHDKLVLIKRKREQNFLFRLLLVAVANSIDDALAHREADLLTVVFAKSARLSLAQSDLFGPVDAFKLRLESKL